jgi:hypothetical protein
MRKALVKTSRASPQIARVDDANEIMTYYEKNICNYSDTPYLQLKFGNQMAIA